MLIKVKNIIKPVTPRVGHRLLHLKTQSTCVQNYFLSQNTQILYVIVVLVKVQINIKILPLWYMSDSQMGSIVAEIHTKVSSYNF